tara:strand:- start:590 stop:1747 length:1158 start_codon:yes stop_codon:yes gene_type:complete
MFERFGDESVPKCTKEMRRLGPDRWPDVCDKENFTNTVKDIYGFNDITSKLPDLNSDMILKMPKGTKINENDIYDLIDGDYNQLLQPGRGYKKINKIENPSFQKYQTENFCVNPPNVLASSDKCKTTIQDLENNNTKTYEHYTGRLKEPINFNTYKVLASHAGITDEDLLPKNYGLLSGQNLDRFKNVSPLSDIDPQYDVPYEFKKEGFSTKKKNYNEFLRENFVDNKVKKNHKQFIKHLKEKNISGNKAKEHMVFSGDSSICNSVLARDCFSNLGSCGGSSYGGGIKSGEAYIQHKSFCQNYCSPVEHCNDGIAIEVDRYTDKLEGKKKYKDDKGYLKQVSYRKTYDDEGNERYNEKIKSPYDTADQTSQKATERSAGGGGFFM